jgi:hypothetical protein
MGAIRPCEPDVVEFHSGWMATTPPDHPYRVGVVGKTEDEARRRFTAAMAAWQELHDRAERAESRSVCPYQCG